MKDRDDLIEQHSKGAAEMSQSNYEFQSDLAYDRQCAAAERHSENVEYAMSQPAMIEKWFAGYELDLDASAELVMAMADALKRVEWKKISFVLEYFEDASAALCDDLADFFSYYGCNEKTAAELWLVITEHGTPLAWEALYEFCEEELRSYQ